MNNPDICCLREGLIGELETINEYNKLKSKCTDARVIKLFESIIDEEKVHVGEFTHAIHMLCPNTELKEMEGMREAEDIFIKRTDRISDVSMI